MARFQIARLLFLAVVVATVLLLSNQALHIALQSSPHIPKDLTTTYNLTKRFEKCDWNAAAEAINQKPFDQLNDACEKPLQKGTTLNCMMQSTDAATWASKWTDTTVVGKYGYTQAVMARYDMDWTGLDTAFEKLGISIVKDKWSKIEQRHLSNGKVDEIEYPWTGAYFVNAINTESGVLVAINNKNSDAINEDRKSQKLPLILPVPPLKQWSNIVFLGLQLFSTTTAPKIRHVFRHHMVNKETKAILGQVIGKEELAADDTNKWPGYEIKIEEIRAKAALGSPNAKGVAWFLGQHKSELGNRYIDKINVFAYQDPSGWIKRVRWCMYMHIVDVVQVSDETPPSEA